MDDLLWNCHICNQVRRDEFISVITTIEDIGGLEVKSNVRYCNDSPSCFDEAKTYSHLKKTNVQ